MSFYPLESVDPFNMGGFILNVEERASLRSSLVLKKNEERLFGIALWGKILGIQNDYFICQSYDETFFDRKYYYTYHSLT